MAAPSNTSWGSIVGSKGRVGIYVATSSTATTTSVSIQVWFWSKYSVSDTSNTYYFNNGATSATTSQGARTIKHTVASGSGWSTSNQTMLGSYSYSYSRGTSAKTIYCAAAFAGIDVVGGTMSAVVGYTIPALAYYLVSYNANGGSGAPGSQTKWYGTTLVLSTIKPTRTGYAFQGWATSASGSVAYAAGGSYTGNAAITLYAVWKANTYAVTYDANGGTDAPANQTKTFGTNLTLSTITPTRTNYNFLGWGISASSTTVAYAAGATYSTDAAITLYAIWELAYLAPRINNLTVQRCNSSGTATESGTYIKVVFGWATDKTVTVARIEHKQSTSSTWTETSVSASGTSGNVSQIIGSNAIDTEYSYNVRVYVADSVGTTYSQTLTIGTIRYPIDILDGRKGVGVAIGKVSDTAELFDVNLSTRIRDDLSVDGSTNVTGDLSVDGDVNVTGNLSVDGDIYDSQNTRVRNGLALYTGSGTNAIDPNTTIEHLIVTDKNTPMGSGKFMYIHTYFYSTKSATSNRAQVALPYNQNGSMYHRYYVNGSWTAWRRHMNADESAVNAIKTSNIRHAGLVATDASVYSSYNYSTVGLNGSPDSIGMWCGGIMTVIDAETYALLAVDYTNSRLGIQTKRYGIASAWKYVTKTV